MSVVAPGLINLLSLRPLVLLQCKDLLECAAIYLGIQYRQLVPYVLLEKLHLQRATATQVHKTLKIYLQLTLSKCY